MTHYLKRVTEALMVSEFRLALIALLTCFLLDVVKFM